MSSIAIMQPYFMPYAGYYRLFAAADLVVMYDCVQFPRRGWVHRNRLSGYNGGLSWLTLPLQKAERNVLIRDLRFTADAKSQFLGQLRRFPCLHKPKNQFAEEIVSEVSSLSGLLPVDYITKLLSITCRHFNFTPPMGTSSSLDIPPALHGQDRIIEIAKRLGATTYINPPGGQNLYDADAFDRENIKLQFLTPWDGWAGSVLELLTTQPCDEVAAEIRRQTELEA